MRTNRIKSLHKSEQIQNILLEKGYHSSVNIMHKPKHLFIKDMKESIGEEEAERIYQKARKNYIKLTHAATAASTATKKKLIEKDGENGEKHLSNIPSYQEIFGSVDYCTCPKCKSIFGPAAYFVDLMRIVKNYIELDEKQAISLSERRKDLWELSLSCDNTNKEKPYIQIVNDILESFLNQENLYETVAKSYSKQIVPFCIPIEKLRMYMLKREANPVHFMECWNIDIEKRILESMAIPYELYEILKSPLSEDGKTKLVGENVTIDEFSNVSVFLERLHLDYEKIYELFYQDLEKEDKSKLHTLFFNECLEENYYISMEDGKILNLTENSLERLLRLVRVSQILGISFAKTEWLLRISCSKEGNIPLEQIGKIWYLSKETGISIDIIVALLADLKDFGDNPFFQIFSISRSEFESLSETQMLRKLCEVLSVEYKDLCILKDYLEVNNSHNIEYKKIDAYYRHILFSRLLGIKIEDYVHVLTLLYDNCLIYHTVETLEYILKFLQQQMIPLDSMIEIITIPNKKEEELPEELRKVSDFLSYISKNMPKEYEQDEKKQEQYVYLQLAEYFGVEKDIISRLFSCVIQKPISIKNMVEKEEFAILDMTVIKQMYTYLLLYRNQFSIELLETVSKYHKVFSIENPSHLNLKDVQTIMQFFKYAQQVEDKVAILYEFVEQYSKGEGRKLLLELTGWKEDYVQAFEEKWFLKGEQIELLTYLERIGNCIYFADKFVWTPEECDMAIQVFLNTYTNYKEADSLSSELTSAVFSEEDNALLETKKRTAIFPWVIEKLCGIYSDVKTENDLYKYFLIDVNMDEKTTISPIKEGINAIQLYLQRCRMHLESGIKEISIPSTWWSWIMDYTMWENNRRIFVYPENYLIPSVRHSKTELFKNVENALGQAAVTEGYIEEQYMKYLDSYYDLTQLKICGAYETQIDYMDVLFIFARTKKEPYNYYFCSRTGNLAWTEWEKIDINIDSNSIYPVYVFGRLYIFWTVVQESEKVKLKDGSKLEADNQRSFVVQIKYTYKNLQGKWISSQTLVNQETIYVKEAGEEWKEAENLSEKFHVYDRPESFQKLTLLKLTKKNVSEFKTEAEGYERLAVITGSFSMHQGQTFEKIVGNSSLDKSQEEYLKRLNRFIENNNYEAENTETGYLNTGFFKVYNEELEEEAFFSQKEFIVVDAYIPSRTSLMYRAVVDDIHKAVGVYLSQSTLQNAIIPAKDRLPFYNNDTTKEKPKISIHSFVMDKGTKWEITEEVSEKIFRKLVSEGIIETVTETEGCADEKALSSTDLRVFLLNILQGENGEGNNQILRIQDILLKNVGAVYLFGKTDVGEIIPVMNQLGKFIYDCKDEAFLVTHCYEHDNHGKKEFLPVPIARLDEGIIIGNIVTPSDIMRLGIEQMTAIQIHDRLIEVGIIGERNQIVLLEKCNRDILEQILEKIELPNERTFIIDKIYSRLMSLPMIYKNEFEGILGISADNICNTLASIENRILYAWDKEKGIYRVDIRKMKEKTDIVFLNESGGVLEDNSITAIYERLEQKVSPVHLNYRVNSDLPMEFRSEYFKNWKFEMQRITNATIKKLRRKLEIGGIGAFLNRETQEPPKEPIMPIERLKPSDNVITPTAKDGGQIDFEGLYGEYNWELFYHIPMMLAQNLSTKGFYEEGLKWFHYVFNPTKKPDETIEKYYWNFFPFAKTQEQTMEQILADEKAISAYNNSPFDPHAIARLRIDAYAKYTIMEYVSHLIAWGDMYFIQNTWESLTTATMFYVWASDLLGERPKPMKEFDEKASKTFQEIEDYYEKQGEIPQFLIELEEKICTYAKENTDFKVNDEIPYNDVRGYFGVPENEQFMQLWDLTKDRLFKIRNSLDINGNKRVTALYEPEKNPMSTISSQVTKNGTIPTTISGGGICCPYRFQYMISYAKSVVSALIQLTTDMQVALEKQDAEELFVLSSTQEEAILQMEISIRENQVEDAKKDIEILEFQKEQANERKSYYEKNSKEFMSEKEKLSLAMGDISAVYETLSGTLAMASGVAHLLPQLGSPFAMKYGGLETGSSLQGMSFGFATIAGTYGHLSQRFLTMSSYERRKEEWELQKKQTEWELKQIEKQLESAKLRQKSTEMDLDIQKKNYEFKKQNLAFLRTKFTNKQLYQWISSKLASTLWQTYQMGLELSLEAQNAYQYETDDDREFLKFDYWDMDHKGICAGQGVMLALNQMEEAYHRNNNRRLEIEKHISMAKVLPEAFKQLKEKGVCSFELSESLFAKDYPSAYLRKIANISISIPAILPPYETIKAVLKQNSSMILTKPEREGINYLIKREGDLPNSIKLCSRYGEKIAVSKGIDDNGMFVLDFKDERYLPFEGTGVHSNWTLEMPKETNYFDMDVIGDVIITVRYRAKEDEARGNNSFYQYVLSTLMEK